MLRFVQSLLLSVWVGGGILLMTIAAPAAFRHAPGQLAGNIVGDMLTRWRLLAILLPLALLAIEFATRRARSRTILLILALLLAGSQVAIDARVHQMRVESPIAISSLAPGDPVRRQFGMLHGASSMMMLAHVLLGAGVMFTTTREVPE